MNPMYYGTLMFLAFVTPMIAIGLWSSRSLRRSSEKRAAGFIISDQESGSRTAE